MLIKNKPPFGRLKENCKIWEADTRFSLTMGLEPTFNLEVQRTHPPLHEDYAKFATSIKANHHIISYFSYF